MARSEGRSGDGVSPCAPALGRCPGHAAYHTRNLRALTPPCHDLHQVVAEQLETFLGAVAEAGDGAVVAAPRGVMGADPADPLAGPSADHVGQQEREGAGGADRYQEPPEVADVRDGQCEHVVVLVRADDEDVAPFAVEAHPLGSEASVPRKHRGDLPVPAHNPAGVGLDDLPPVRPGVDAPGLDATAVHDHT